MYVQIKNLGIPLKSIFFSLKHWVLGRNDFQGSKGISPGQRKHVFPIEENKVQMLLTDGVTSGEED